uniref:RNA polymerase sigma factor ShbA n=1 Tax=Lentzea alba TaxID=2714351 RepID=UPI0039BF64DC
MRDKIDDDVSAAAAGDHRARARLFAHLYPLITRYCRARIGMHLRDMADDVVQESLMSVLQALPKYRVTGSSFLAFAYGIAAHKVADARRRLARNRTDPVNDVPDMAWDGVGPEQHALRSELSARMGTLLGELSEWQREILILRIVVGLSGKETAEAIGSTSGAVRVAQHRALSKLRAAIAVEQGLLV